MTLQNFISQIGLTDQEVEAFAEKLTSGSTLKELCKVLDGKIDEKKAFAFAKVYCKSIFASDIEDIAPKLIDERDRILKKDKDKLVKDRMVKDHLKVLKQIEEDLTLYLMEKKGKIPAS